MSTAILIFDFELIISASCQRLKPNRCLSRYRTSLTSLRAISAVNATDSAWWTALWTKGVYLAADSRVTYCPIDDNDASSLISSLHHFDLHIKANHISGWLSIVFTSSTTMYEAPSI